MTFELQSKRRERHFGEFPDPRREAIIQSSDAEEIQAELDRFEYGRDYDRLLYSSAFRKLGGVTQVVSASRELGDFHNRMTHSLKVAQTGVRLAVGIQKQDDDTQDSTILRFGGLHPSVVRAACLAHDFGHPPFGHIGEDALRDICEDPRKYIPSYDGRALPDSFEGNAQTFKIVTRLAFREAVPDAPELEPALNLTNATLAAISKYPWAKGDEIAKIKGGKKWGAYATEAKLLTATLSGLTAPRESTLYGKEHIETRTIEAQIMDLADDIAYAVHDIEDFFRAGLIPLDELAKLAKEFNDFTDAARANLKASSGLPLTYDKEARKYGEPISIEEIRRVLKKFDVGHKVGVFTSVPRHAYDGSRTHRRVVHAFASGLIGRTTTGVRVNSEGVVVYSDPDTHVVVEVLKQLTDYYVVRTATIGSAQVGQRNILIQLVGALYDWLLGEMSDESSEVRGLRGRITLPARLEDYYDLNVALNRELEESVRSDPAGVLLRTVIDYVASLTDEQARAWHDRICLGKMTSMLDRYLFI